MPISPRDCSSRRPASSSMPQNHAGIKRQDALETLFGSGVLAAFSCLPSPPRCPACQTTLPLLPCSPTNLSMSPRLATSSRALCISVCVDSGRAGREQGLELYLVDAAPFSGRSIRSIRSIHAPTALSRASPCLDAVPRGSYVSSEAGRASNRDAIGALGRVLKCIGVVVKCVEVYRRVSRKWRGALSGPSSGGDLRC